jgi:hypothetical protein
MSSTIVELNEEFIEERAVEALEGLSLFLASDPEIINSMSAEEVMEQLELLDVPASTSTFEEMMCLIRRHDAFGNYPEGSELDVENDIVVRMSPIKRQKVKLRVKNSGQAKLRVVHDPLPDE